MIRIRGARQHNLRNLDLEIPHGKLVVMTGPSGSGKSSLAFHTLFAEGQRRFIESLSAYARQFLDQLEKPDVDAIEGLSPAIAIEQRSGGLNPRSTVATATELYEHLRVLWAAAGTPHDPETGERLERMTSADMVAALLQEAEGTKLVLLAPVPKEETSDAGRLIGDLRRQGFVRVRVDGEILDLEEAEAGWPEHPRQVEVVVDRLVVRDGASARLADSVETVLRICGSEARVLVQEPDSEGWDERSFQTSYRNPKTGFTIGELSPRHFSFNSHLGACRACEGLGTERFCDPELLVGDPETPLLEGAITGWWKPKAQRGKLLINELAALLRMFGVDESVRLRDLPDEARQLLFHGGMLETGWKVGAEKKPQIKKYEGLCVEAERKLRVARSEAVRRRILRVMAERPCRVCEGRRLKPELLAVRIEGAGGRWLGIQDFCALPVDEALAWLAGVRLAEDRAEICGRLVGELNERLSFLDEVGLGYLGLDRASGTLSGGEAQRIRLATQLGSGLTGVLYVLDEPSIGLHAEDTGRLIGALERLRDRGNTVVVVEHDESMIRAADWLVELGPGAGADGGLLLANGAPEDCGEAPTMKWLAAGRRTYGLPRAGTAALLEGELVIRGARENNLQNIDVKIPLGGICCLTGPSGSGKSTLANDILMRALKRRFHGAGDRPGEHDGIDGMDRIGKAVVVDQAPIGRSPRSNPATFTGAFDLIRSLFAKLPLSRQRGYGPGRFSFNTRGGRCEKCEGAGRLKVEMHFLPDAWIECNSCGGRRFNRETLEVTFKGLSIADVLELGVVEAHAAFAAVPKLAALLRIMEELGLGYLRLGQPANTLSGGEAQRLKLAVELSRPAAPHTFYFFDEPTTGLHFGDVDRLLGAFARLRESGHSVLVVEHHLGVIAAADHVIDLGPGGGRNGGQVVARGTPAEVAMVENSATGRALAANLS
ncbi:excinuclease ABC subunit UvrA [Haloferula sp. A504]|uniref:excinuclease ABC subunit UvrA n=1 Tax=Haloferula sp. A504 TaxID=3373601 RepID=UPI0031CBD196|nr:excinuclease ABC subunit UvrA [Verrucomicrobiaceae bacterium E54]